MSGKLGQPDQSDLTFWGISALVAAGIAVLSTTISGFLPDGVLGGLHANRLQGGTLNQLRAQVEQLTSEQVRLQRQSDQLRSQLSLAERSSNQVGQRVSALESSIPLLLEVVPPGAEIDPYSITASIEEEAGEVFEVEGGSVSIVQTPLFEDDGSDEDGGMDPLAQPVPDMLAPLPGTLVESSMSVGDQLAGLSDPAINSEVGLPGASGTAGPAQTPSTATGPAARPAQPPSGAGQTSLSQTRFGIALGDSVTLEDADARWQDISGKVGALLIGLQPAVSDPLQNNSLRIVLGPISNYSEAEMLCGRIVRVGIDCLPVQYANEQMQSL